MPTLAEQLQDPVSTPIHDALVAGVDTLGQNEVVTFYPYVRTVLPVDGFVFWMNATLLTPNQLAIHGLQSPDGVTVEGSLHYATIGHQIEDETISVRRVDFTAETQITAFAEIAPDVMYVATWETSLGSFQFTFSQRSTYYVQSNIHHYVGDAIFPAFASQLIDDLSNFDQRQIVSNSLPIWLAMFASVPFPTLITVNYPIYPSFLVPVNLTPPYVAVDIPPTSTRALQSVPYLDRKGNHWQLTAERVRLIIYGLRNDEALDLQDMIIQYSVDTDLFGLTNMPIMRDEHRQQVELAVLAQRKTIELEITYQQTRARSLARVLISEVIAPTVIGILDGPGIVIPPLPLVPPLSPLQPIYLYDTEGNVLYDSNGNPLIANNSPHFP